MAKFKMRASFSRKCLNCKKLFVPNWSHVRHAWSRYCCARCGKVGHYEATKVLAFPPFDSRRLVELKSRWDAGETCLALAKRFGVGDKYIRRELRRAGVDAKNFRRGRRPTNARTYRFEAFRERSPLSAYWAGFIMADGCIRDGGEFVINVHEQDRPHLIGLAKWLGLKREAVYKCSPQGGAATQFKLHLMHKFLLRDLAAWGVVPRKSYNFVRPQVADRLFTHFVRGWFDGDGCFQLRPHRERCRITGNHEAMGWLAAEIAKRTSYRTAPRVVEGKPGQAWAKLLIDGPNKVLGFVEWAAPKTGDPGLARKWKPAVEWARQRRGMLATCTDKRILRRGGSNPS